MKIYLYWKSLLKISLILLHSCTFESYKKCSKAVKPVNERFAFESRFTQQKDTVVAFEMLTDDIEQLKKKVIPTVHVLYCSWIVFEKDNRDLFAWMITSKSWRRKFKNSCMSFMNLFSPFLINLNEATPLSSARRNRLVF